MTPARGHWLVALTAALMLHIGVAVAVLWQPPTSGARSSGSGGLEVSLGAAGGAPGSVELEAPDNAETNPAAEAPAEVAPETAETRTPQPTEVSEPATAEAVAAPPPDTQHQATESTNHEPDVAEAQTPEVAAASEVPPAREALALAEPPPEAAQAEEPEPRVERAEAVEPGPESPPEPVTESQPEPAPEAASKPEPEPATEPAEPETASKVEAEQSPTQEATAAPVKAADAVTEPEAVSASTAGAGGEGGTRDSQQQGSGDARTAGGAPGARADYFAELRASLARNKQYPRRAQMRRQEGRAMLRLVVDRDGGVVEYALEQSSGHSALDREVGAMVRRASPLPPFPDDLDRDRLELVVPVQFSLR